MISWYGTGASDGTGRPLSASDELVTSTLLLPLDQRIQRKKRGAKSRASLIVNAIANAKPCSPAAYSGSDERGERRCGQGGLQGGRRCPDTRSVTSESGYRRQPGFADPKRDAASCWCAGIFLRDSSCKQPWDFARRFVTISEVTGLAGVNLIV